MQVLLIGSGGREHALAWKLAQSPALGKLYAAPGNPGIASYAELVPLDIADHAAVLAFARAAAIDFVVVGPEAPLVAGLADVLQAAGIRVFGPTAAAARLEGSKGFTKDFCARFGIPTAAYGRFSDAAAAAAYVRARGAPIVVKADGLAAGKGVTVAATMEEALAAVAACFDGAFGGAGSEVVVEEVLQGEEASFFCLCATSSGKPARCGGVEGRAGSRSPTPTCAFATSRTDPAPTTGHRSSCLGQRSPASGSSTTRSQAIPIPLMLREHRRPNRRNRGSSMSPVDTPGDAPAGTPAGTRRDAP